MESSRVLLVVTSSSTMGSSPTPTGAWLEEVAAPYYAFKDARCSITLASPRGGAMPLDPKGAEEANQTASTRRFEADVKARDGILNTKKLSEINPADYDAVFFAGGHGTMDDFPTDASVKATVEAFFRAGKPVASVCHGPACLVQATDSKGHSVVNGRRFTCFSDAEETAIGAHVHVPFMLETRLSELGGTPVQAGLFESNTVVDGHLITGQNPASSIPVAEALIAQLRKAALAA
jgi:putative intracellular protease/amidase